MLLFLSNQINLVGQCILRFDNSSSSRISCFPSDCIVHLGGFSSLFSLITVSLLPGFHYFLLLCWKTVMFLEVFKPSEKGSLFHDSSAFLYSEISSTQVFESKRELSLCEHIRCQMLCGSLLSYVRTWRLCCNPLSCTLLFPFLLKLRKIGGARCASFLLLHTVYGTQHAVPTVHVWWMKFGLQF